MKDYTTANYCDFLWINDLLELKKHSKYGFSFQIWKNGKPTPITISNVIIFGTIVEVKQIGHKGYLYHLDDGTGVIACKHNEEQFEEIISMIESEQCEIFNNSQQFREKSLCDTSSDDTIFNDKSMQADELDMNKRNRLLGLQSIWDDIYQNFNCLIQVYKIGDSVIIQGKLYNYFNRNQIYINSIRKMDLAEEIAKVANKLEQQCEKLNMSLQSEKQRLSGLMTFDSIEQLNPKFTNPRSIKVPEMKNIQEEGKILSPNLKSTITFDTFLNKE